VGADSHALARDLDVTHLVGARARDGHPEHPHPVHEPGVFLIAKVGLDLGHDLHPVSFLPIRQVVVSPPDARVVLVPPDLPPLRIPLLANTCTQRDGRVYIARSFPVPYVNVGLPSPIRKEIVLLESPATTNKKRVRRRGGIWAARRREGCTNRTGSDPRGISQSRRSSPCAGLRS
jgi:hypothetical protein